MRNLLLFLCIPVAVSLSGCGSGGSGSSSTAPSLTLTVTANQTVRVDETKTLLCSAVDSDGRTVSLNADDIYWSVASGNDKLRFQQGKALGLLEGTAKVTATYRTFTSAEATVTVLEKVLAHSTDDKITITGPTGAVPDDTTITVETKTADQFTLPQGVGIFSAGAAVTPSSVTFDKPITITFTLSKAVDDGYKLCLYKPGIGGELEQVKNSSGGLVTATLSGGGMIATITMDSFNADSYALIAIPN